MLVGPSSWCSTERRHRGASRNKYAHGRQQDTIIFCRAFILSNRFYVLLRISKYIVPNTAGTCLALAAETYC